MKAKIGPEPPCRAKQGQRSAAMTDDENGHSSRILKRRYPPTFLRLSALDSVLSLSKILLQVEQVVPFIEHQGNLATGGQDITKVKKKKLYRGCTKYCDK
jgi:hypothetical protein